MKVYELILKKRNGDELSTEEIKYLVSAYTIGEIPDYQMAAFLMAVFFQGMSKRETADLTFFMARSGDLVDLSPIRGLKVDKHSTGGVGDKTSLVLIPLVAAVGVPVAKMSGRGLGHTGGTIDKLESIPGFSASLSRERFIDSVNTISLAIAGQTENLAPADKKLYALRDVTATVDSIPLIASSIMSKKIAAGADAIVLDVKTGRGAFMKGLDEATELARTMVEIGAAVGRKTVALVTDMNQPLGKAVGNALEVKEAIQTLNGEGPEDLLELCLALGAEMVTLAGRVDSPEEGRGVLMEALSSGKALAKLCQMVVNQGGDERYILHPELLPQARHQLPILADTSGFISAIDALEVGLTVMALGAGRAHKDDIIDPAPGIVLAAKVGDRVEKGQVLAKVHVNDPVRAEGALERLRKAISISEQASRTPLIYQRVVA